MVGREAKPEQGQMAETDHKFLSQHHNKKGRQERGKRLVHPGREEGVSGNSWNCSAVSTFGCFTD